MFWLTAGALHTQTRLDDSMLGITRLKEEQNKILTETATKELVE